MDKNTIKILYIAPSASSKTGVADYALKFKEILNQYSKSKIIMENPFNFQTNYSFFDIFKIRKSVCRLDNTYDLIHAEMSSSSYAEFWYLYFSLKKFRAIPIAITIHDSPYICYNPFHIFFSQNYQNFFFLRLFRKFLDVSIGYFLEKAIIKNTKLSFVTTKVGAIKFKQRFKKINFVYHLPHLAFNETPLVATIEKPKNYILFFGFLRKNKGVDILIDAFNKLLAENDILSKNLKLILCGGYNENDTYFANIKEQILALDLINKIKITGYVERDYLQGLFESSICTVLPYYSKKTYSSSGALIRVLEAGSPAIVSDIPMLTEYIEDGYNGLVFKENDSEDLCSKILTLVKDHQLRRKLSQNATVYIKTMHNNKFIARKVLRSYIITMTREL